MLSHSGTLKSTEYQQQETTTYYTYDPCVRRMEDL